MLRGTSTPLPNALLSLRFPYKYKPKLPLSDFNSNAQEFHLEVPLTKSNCYDSWYSRNMAIDICLEPFNFQSLKRFEVWIAYVNVLSIDWTIFIIQILNAFFIT